MQVKDQGVILRCTKYGETSLIIKLFTSTYGLRSYMLKGVRKSEKKTRSNIGALQIGNIIDFVSTHKPHQQLSLITEYQIGYFYKSIPEEIVKSCIVSFSVELLNKLMPSDNPMEELFAFLIDYLKEIDNEKHQNLANFPILFCIGVGRLFGYQISGSYSASSPYISIEEGVFSDQMPQYGSVSLTADEAAILSMLNTANWKSVYAIKCTNQQRHQILDWCLTFLHFHTQQLGHLKSLEILRVILKPV